MRRAAAAVALAALAAPASALGLVETARFDLLRPSSLEYDPTFCGLWIAGEGSDAILVTLDGQELRRVQSAMGRIKAIALEGDALLVADGRGRMQRLSKDGEALGEPFELGGGYTDTEALAVASDGTIVTVEDDPAWLSFFAPDGALLRRVDTMDLDPPLSEPQGLAIDPRTGHLLVVDDREGTNALYEFDAEGGLLAQADLLEFGDDPEGIAIRPGSNQLFVAFDGGAEIVAFDYEATLPPGAAGLPPGADCMMF